MTTNKQKEANRRNAQKSTGPRTEEGKARSSRNATKHGLTAETVVLPGEDITYFESFRFGLFESFRPEGAYENQLVLRLAAQQWRLQRIPAIEADLWARLANPIPGFGDPLAGNTISSAMTGGDANAMPDLSLAWMNDGDSPYGGALGRLARYETMLERSCTRITAELRRAQRARLKMEDRDSEQETREYTPQPDHTASEVGRVPAPGHPEAWEAPRPGGSTLERPVGTGHGSEGFGSKGVPHEAPPSAPHR